MLMEIAVPRKIFIRLPVMRLSPQRSPLFPLPGKQLSHLIGKAHLMRRMEFLIIHHSSLSFSPLGISALRGDLFLAANISMVSDSKLTITNIICFSK